MEIPKLTPELIEKIRADGKVISAQEPCLCGKLLSVEQWIRKWHSGAINYTDLLCEDCRKEFKGWPRIVCLGCRSLMGFIKAGREPSGFKFEAGKHYHIRTCPRCLPSSTHTEVLEHAAYYEDQGLVVKTEKEDIVQEIEQKVLQSEIAAAKFGQEVKDKKLLQ